MEADIHSQVGTAALVLPQAAPDGRLEREIMPDLAFETHIGREAMGPTALLATFQIDFAKELGLARQLIAL